jgi:hypothetical protein
LKNSTKTVFKSLALLTKSLNFLKVPSKRMEIFQKALNYSKKASNSLKIIFKMPVILKKEPCGNCSIAKSKNFRNYYMTPDKYERS